MVHADLILVMQNGRITWTGAVMWLTSSGWLVCQDLWVSIVRNGRRRSWCLIKTNGLCLSVSYSSLYKFWPFCFWLLPLVHYELSRVSFPLCSYFIDHHSCMMWIRAVSLDSGLVMVFIFADASPVFGKSLFARVSYSIVRIIVEMPCQYGEN